MTLLRTIAVVLATLLALASCGTEPDARDQQAEGTPAQPPSFMGLTTRRA